VFVSVFAETIGIVSSFLASLLSSHLQASCSLSIYSWFFVVPFIFLHQKPSLGFLVETSLLVKSLVPDTKNRKSQLNLKTIDTLP